MNDRDFTTAFTVDRTPREVFDAITNVRGWWSEQIDGGTSAVDDELAYRYQDAHRCTVRVTEVVPEQKVAWLVLDNYFDFTEDQSEWQGTTVSFEIGERHGQTEVRFAHLGLLPEHECYDVCSNAWSGYVNGSLRSLIETGKGQPNPREDEPSPR